MYTYLSRLRKHVSSITISLTRIPDCPQAKALLRRATARTALQKYTEAEKDLRQVGWGKGAWGNHVCACVDCALAGSPCEGSTRNKVA